MPESYPLPAYAVSMWIAGDDLFIAFPGQGPEERGHTIKLPASIAGFQTTIAIMRERQSARSLKLGQRGTPTQWELEQDKRYGAILEAMGKAKAVSDEDRRRAELELEELGL